MNLLPTLREMKTRKRRLTFRFRYHFYSLPKLSFAAAYQKEIERTSPYLVLVDSHAPSLQRVGDGDRINVIFDHLRHQCVHWIENVRVRPTVRSAHVRNKFLALEFGKIVAPLLNEEFAKVGGQVLFLDGV